MQCYNFLHMIHYFIHNRFETCTYGISSINTRNAVVTKTPSKNNLHASHRSSPTPT